MSDLPYRHRPGASVQPAPCPTFAKNLSDLMEGACSPDLGRWLARHAEACPECGRALATGQALRRTLQALGREEPSARYRLALAVALQQERDPDRLSTGAWRRGLGLSALLAMGVVLAGLLLAGEWAGAPLSWPG